MKAKQKKIDILEIRSLNIDIKNRLEILEINEPPERKPGIKVEDVDSLVEKLKKRGKCIMKILVVIEHDNKTVKQSSYSTITAASLINDNVEAIVMGDNLSSISEELKKSDHLKKIYVVDNNLFKNPLAENLSKTLKIFIEDKTLHTFVSINYLWKEYVSKACNTFGCPTNFRCNKDYK